MELQGDFTLAIMFLPFFFNVHILSKKGKGVPFFPNQKLISNYKKKNVLMMVHFLLIQENYALNYKSVYSFKEKKPISTLTLAGCSQQEHLCLHWVPIYHACRSNQHSIHELIIMRQKKNFLLTLPRKPLSHNSNTGCVFKTFPNYWEIKSIRTTFVRLETAMASYLLKIKTKTKKQTKKFI